MQVLHHEELEAVIVTDVVDGADVRMGEAGDDAGLALEAAAGFVAGHFTFGQDLESDGATQAGIAGAIDLTHAAGADGGLDFVGAQLFAGGQRHRPPRWGEIICGKWGGGRKIDWF